MKSAPLLLLVAVIFSVTAFDALAQAAQKKRKGANPEGQAVRKPVPESVKVERDIVYATYGERKVMLDLYLPKKPPSGKRSLKTSRWSYRPSRSERPTGMLVEKIWCALTSRPTSGSR